MLFFYVLKLDVLKNRVLERSGLDFGASGPRFWRLWASILADFKKFWDRFSAKIWLESVSYQQVRISWFRLKFMKVFHPACQQHENKL